MTKLARQGKLEGEGGLRGIIPESLKMGCDIDFVEKPFFRTALWEATWRNHEPIVRLLADKGATVSFADYQGRTPLHEACYYGHMNLVEYFLDKGHPINVVDNFGQSPIFRAVDGGRHDVVKYLVEKKAETNLLDTHDVTVGHCAAFTGLPGMSQWLLYEGAWKNRFIDDDTSKRSALPQKEALAGKGAQEGIKEVAEEDAAPAGGTSARRLSAAPL